MHDFPEPNNDCETEERAETYTTEFDDGKYMIIHTTHTLLLTSYVLLYCFHFFIDIPNIHRNVRFLKIHPMKISIIIHSICN